METSEDQIFPGFEEVSLCSAQACPASQPVLPGSEKAIAMTVGSGRQLSMLLDQSSPLGAFSKILLESSLWTSSEEFCYVWNRLDTRFALSAFQLTPLGQSTDGNGSSLWRTPNSAIVTGGGQDGEKRLDAGHAMQLSDQVLTPKLWPTPNAGNFNDGESLETWEARREANKAKGINGNGQGTPLAIAAKLWPESLTDAARGDGGMGRLWPTPIERDWKSTSHATKDSGSGSLNPRFVEELMGFPIDHTALKLSVTPSSHNKPIRSSRQSPKPKGVHIRIDCGRLF